MSVINLRHARVKEIKSERPGYIEAIVDAGGSERRAVCYTSLIGDIRPGDDVVINTTAVDLGLGTGGRHFIVWNLVKESVNSKERGHIMKLRYTPLQLKCLAVEEDDSPYHDILKEVLSIEGMPVIIGTLHSQLPAAAAVVRATMPQAKIAYIMTDGAALPLAFSELTAVLKEKGIIDVTVTTGNSFGGDYEAINIFSGLAAARHVAAADIAIVCMGPGIVGSGTKLGFTGIEQGQIVNAVNSLKGTPIAIPRISFGDARERHYGISHHTITSLTVAALSHATVPVPEMGSERAAAVDRQIKMSGLDRMHTIETIDAEKTLEILRSRGLTPTTMGRTMDEEPEFFMAAGAAGIYAARIL